jgi:hypothetical protein
LRIQGNILYKIYYGEQIVYLGRTKQPLQDRIRGHLFKKPMHRAININLVSKIEYALFKTEADMNVYEIYYINKLKPPLNCDDKAQDDLTVSLPEVEWKEFSIPIWNKWKEKIQEDDAKENEKLRIKAKYAKESITMRKKFHNGEISEDEYFDFINKNK